MSRLFDYLERKLHARGYDIKKYRQPLDLSREAIQHPLDVVHKAGRAPVIFNVALSACRHLGQMAFPGSTAADATSPFIQTLRAYEQGHELYAGSWLEAYYARCQPRSAAEVLAVDEAVLASLPPAGAIKLWELNTPRERAAHRRRVIEKANRRLGLEAGADEGDHYWGPVSARKGQLELERLLKTYTSIKQQGFRVDPQGQKNIQVICLGWQDEWRFMVDGGGNHRLAALSVLGQKTIPVQLNTKHGQGGVLRHEDAEHWPVVVNGHLTPAQARRIFECLFHGQQSAAAADWHALLQTVEN